MEYKYNYKVFIEDAHERLQETGGRAEVYSSKSLSQLESIIPVLEGMDKGLVWSTGQVYAGFVLLAQYAKLGAK